MAVYLALLTCIALVMCIAASWVVLKYWTIWAVLSALGIYVVCAIMLFYVLGKMP